MQINIFIYLQLLQLLLVQFNSKIKKYGAAITNATNTSKTENNQQKEKKAIQHTFRFSSAARNL